MPVHDFQSQRLFVEQDLASGRSIACTREQANYLLAVLRMRAGEAILIFNGRDGEWHATIAPSGRRSCNLNIDHQTRPQEAARPVTLAFAPLKRGRLDYMVQKAVEMGVARLQPVFTAHTVPDRINRERMRLNAIEAAEQCGILHLADIAEPTKLAQLTNGWPTGHHLIFCDERADGSAPLDTLSSLKSAQTTVLIGPEGGFTEQERAHLLAVDGAVPLSLGPRIMRADTAAVAALALVNATIGDWGSTV